MSDPVSSIARHANHRTTLLHFVFIVHHLLPSDHRGRRRPPCRGRLWSCRRRSPRTVAVLSVGIRRYDDGLLDLVDPGVLRTDVVEVFALQGAGDFPLSTPAIWKRIKYSKHFCPLIFVRYVKNVVTWKYSDECSLVDVLLRDSDPDNRNVDCRLMLEGVTNHESLLLPRPLRQAPQNRVDLSVGRPDCGGQGANRARNLTKGIKINGDTQERQRLTYISMSGFNLKSFYY